MSRLYICSLTFPTLLFLTFHVTRHLDIPYSHTMPALHVEVPYSYMTPALHVEVPYSHTMPALHVDVPYFHTMPTLHVDDHVSPSAYVLGIAGCVVGLLTFGNRSSPLVWADLSLQDREALRAFARTSLVILGSMPFILRCPLT